MSAGQRVLTEPPRSGSPRVYSEPITLVLLSKRLHGVVRRRGWWRDVVDRPAVRPPEVQLAIRVAIDLEALLVHRAVMTATQQDQVRQRRRPTLRPMMDVMTLPKTHATAREAAAAVTVLEGPTKRRRNRASPRADFDNSPVGVVSHDDAAGVARQALGRSSWNARAVLEHGLARRVGVFQDVGIDVDHDLKPLSWSAGVELVS